MFIRGQAAIMFGYSYHLPLIVAGRRSDFNGDDATQYLKDLNIGVSSLPQIAGAAQPVNIANYWVETVSKKVSMLMRLGILFNLSLRPKMLLAI